MEGEGEKKKASSILKKLERCVRMNPRKMEKSKSWSGGGERRRAAAAGCFSVYVGPERQRFVIKTGFVNHPLFKMLLEDAELEYGFSSDGPLLLPCHVDLFCELLAEMECAAHDLDGCLSPARRRFGRREMQRDSLLTPLRSFNI
ncbi:auxin-responsive protein SAUR71-like [Salvia miltiorrhiza]|uniref:auxin-responsive protein SAUR71-like n=1 Tax=Salvia miltiorrhiza TaxID=226208 RepID=UPI0025AB990D|nr:auxin-responsive protein SAUR71-like [Salvia miltiorrhiza]